MPNLVQLAMSCPSNVEIRGEDPSTKIKSFSCHDLNVEDDIDNGRTGGLEMSDAQRKVLGIDEEKLEATRRLETWKGKSPAQHRSYRTFADLMCERE